MRVFSVLAFVIAAGIFLSFSGTNTFEGNLTITSGKSGAEASSKTVLAVKGDRLAINPGGKQQMVLNVNSGDFLSVVNQGGQQMLIKLNVGALSGLKDMPAFLGPFSNYLGTTSKGKAEVTSSQETKTISGYKARKYIIKDEANTTTVWLTQDLPFSITPMLDMLKLSEGMDATLKSGFPLEGTIKDNKSGEVSNFKVAVEKKAVDEKLFAFPANLSELDMTPLVKQMIETNDPAQITQMLNQFMPK